MKKFLTGLLVLLCMAALTGCGKNDISLTNEENDLVAEYIAGTLLKQVLTAVHRHHHRVSLLIHINLLLLMQQEQRQQI